MVWKEYPGGRCWIGPGLVPGWQERELAKMNEKPRKIGFLLPPDRPQGSGIALPPKSKTERARGKGKAG